MDRNARQLPTNPTPRGGGRTPASGGAGTARSYFPPPEQDLSPDGRPPQPPSPTPRQYEREVRTTQQSSRQREAFKTSTVGGENGRNIDERAVQQTNRYQESFERSTVGGEVVKSTDSYTNRVEIEEYLDRSLDSKTLADCILTLEDGVQLRIEWTSLDDKPANSILDLDKFIGNIDGRFVWGNGASGFSQSCNNPRLEGTFLVASCFYNGTYTEDRLNLDLYIIYSSAPSGDSGPGFGPVDSDFSEFMAAPNDWMNLTIITQPDMRTFLGHPRFQKVVSGVAHRAVGEAMVEMQYVMQQMAQQMVQQMVGEAMAMVRRRSTLHIEREMNQLVKTAAVHTAAYSNVDGFRLMQAGAIPPYNAFAAQIKAPLLSPESVED